MTRMKLPPQGQKWTPIRPTLLLMSDDKRRPRPAVQYGPTAAAVARNVKRIREGRGMTIYALSGALGKAGRPITPSAVAKIEKQQRQVTVDDLTALAEVLDVSPATLLLPAADKAREPVQLTPRKSVPWQIAWRWMHGQCPPFTPDCDDDPRAARDWRERRRRFIAENRPYVDPGLVDEVAQLVSAYIEGDWHLEVDREGDNTRGTLAMHSKGHSGMPRIPEVETTTTLEEQAKVLAQGKRISLDEARRRVWGRIGEEPPESSESEGEDR